MWPIRVNGPQRLNRRSFLFFMAERCEGGALHLVVAGPGLSLALPLSLSLSPLHPQLMGINKSCVAERESARLGSTDLVVAGPGLAGRLGCRVEL